MWGRQLFAYIWRFASIRDGPRADGSVDPGAMVFPCHGGRYFAELRRYEVSAVTHASSTSSTGEPRSSEERIPVSTTAQLVCPCTRQVRAQLIVEQHCDGLFGTCDGFIRSKGIDGGLACID